MERLNYFNSYQSKPDHYEDHLTRAWLVLLRYSFHTFTAFIDYCKTNHSIVAGKEERPIALNDLLENGWEMDTQKSNPVIGTNWVLSVLITDSAIASPKESITASERNARYDGIITFGSQLTIVIENKPRSGNVWFEQLNPSREGLSDETKVYRNAAHLEWKEIIRQLNHLLNIPTLSGCEKMMIEDFLSFIDHNFPYLNPYDSFHLCKGYPELINRRIQNLLKSVVLNEETVKYHHGWGYYIETPYMEIKQIGLLYNSKENNWWLELSMFFGDTQSQAKSFYKCNPTVDHLSEDWWSKTNFHVAFRSTNLVWFQHVPDFKKYISFWTNNVHEIYQIKRDDVRQYLQWLQEEGIITFTKEDEENLEREFYDTAMRTLNICPGFGSVYEITDKEAEELDKTKELKKMVVNAIREGLKIIGKDGSEFLAPL